MTPSAIILKAKKQGVHLYLKDNKLAFKANKGAFTAELRALVSENKTQITELLQAHSVQSEVIPVRAPDAKVPLTKAQQRMFFLHQLDSRSSAYNMTFGLELEGELEASKILDAITESVAAHAILNSVVVEKDGQNYLQHLPQMRPEIETSSVQSHALSLAEHKKQIFEKHYRRNINLVNGPTVFIELFKYSDTISLLYFTTHHMFFDGLSFGLLSQEILGRYFGQTQPTAKTISFEDYAVWQQTTDANAQSLTYWEERLAGIPQCHSLPLDRERSPSITSKGCFYEPKFDQGLYEQLKVIAGQFGVSLFSLIHTAFSLTVAIWSRQEDVVTGVPVSGREQKQLQNVIGMFANTLVYRAKFDFTQSFSHTVKSQHKHHLEGLNHQSVALEDLVVKVQPNRSMDHTPLFQLFFNLFSVEELQKNDDKLALKPIEIDGFDMDSKFDLSLNLIERSTLEVCWDFDQSIFDESTIVQFHGGLISLLRKVVSQPDICLSDIKVIEETATPVQSKVQFESVISQFIQHAKKTPNAIAIQSQGQSLSYEMLALRVNALAKELDQQTNQSDYVAIIGERNSDFLAAMLACLSTGRAYIPVDALMPSERMQLILETAQAGAVINCGFDTQLAADIKQLNGYQGECVEHLALNPTADDTAYIIYTSGSTGTPKGVAITQSNLAAFIDAMAARVSFNSQHSMLALTTPSFDISLVEMIMPLTQGGTVLMSTAEQSKDATALAALIAEYQPHFIQATPATWQMLLAEPDLHLHDSVALVGGEALSHHLAVSLTSQCEKVWNCYGPTEATVWSLVGEVSKHSLLEQGVIIGNELAGYQHFVVDKHMNILPKGAIGELVIVGAGVGAGYWNNTSQTQKVFRTDILDGHVCYLTGDLVKQNSDGTFAFLGRADQQVKVRGYRIELGEVEHQLQRVIGADIPCAVTTKPDPQGFMNLVGYCCDDLDWASIESQLANSLPDYMIPRQWLCIESLPLNANGKVNRAQLPDIDFTPSEYQAPSNKVEVKLQEIWQRLLDIDSISVTDNFFSLGGNSLKINKMLHMIKEEMGLQLALSQVFKSPTIVELARLTQTSEQGEEIHPLPQGHIATLSSAQLRIWLTENLGAGASNNIPMALTLEGELDVSRLEHALKQVMNKHTALRTSIVEVNGIVQQLVQSMDEVHVPWTANQNQHDQGNTHLQARYAEFMGEAFELSKGPLFKVHLEQIGKHKYALFCVFHHIVFDGWSFGVFLNDMIEAYVSLGAEPEFTLSVNEVGYADYANWQQAWMAGDKAGSLKAFWRDNLANAPQETRLLADKTNSASLDAAREVIELDPSLLEKLRATARRLDTNLFNLLFGSFNLLVSKLTGQADVVTGIPVAGRELSQTQDMIGMFVNNLPVRVQVNEADSLAQFFANHMATVADVFAHQALPFESIIELGAQQRSETATPLFQMFFNMLNLPEPEARLEDVNIKPLFSEDVAAKFDLTLYVSELETRTQLLLVYQPSRFSEARMAEFLQHYLSVLQQVVSAQDTALSEVTLAPTAEVKSLPHNWNGSVAALFESQLEANAEQIAIETALESMTYDALANKRAQLAGQLQSFELSQGDVVAIAAQRNAETVAAVLAILHAGFAFTLIDLSHGSEKVRAQLQASTAKLLLYPENEVLSVRLLDGLKSFALPQISQWQWPMLETSSQAQAQDLACVTFTSGSTGQVKAVRGSHAGLANYLSWFTKAYHISSKDRVSMLSGLTHDPLQRDMFEALCTGATLVIPNEEHMQPGALAQWITNSAISIMHMTPSQTLLIGEQNTSAHAMRHIFLVGELLTEAVMSRLQSMYAGSKIHNVYGATETQRCLSFNECGAQYDPTTIECDSPDTQFRVHQANGALGVLGQVGEIVVWSHNLSLGYMGDSELTADKFIQGAQGNRGYKTGDLGYMMENGKIRLLGRDDRQVKLRGYRIELGEVESHLEQCDGITRAAVCFEQDPDSQHDYLAAYVAVEPHFDMDTAKKQLRSNMPIYMIPTHWAVLNALPLNASGKVDYLQLTGASLIGSDSLVPAQTRTEHELLALWLDILPVSQIGIENNFFESGGHSIDAANMLANIKQHFAIDLSLRQVFDNPTIKEMAYLLDSLEAKALLNSTDNDNNNNNDIEVIEL